MTCRTPGCQAEQVEGRRFCGPCAERLDRVRDEIESGKDHRLRSAAVSGRRRRKRPPRLPE